jgi:hypothetical protein
MLPDTAVLEKGQDFGHFAHVLLSTNKITDNHSELNS